MLQKALLFGLNYVSDPSLSLSGCIADAVNLRSCLIDDMGWNEDDIWMCTDDTIVKPTRSNMINLIGELVTFAQGHRDEEITLFISYSGHGSVQLDASGDEKDGKDSVLVPLDVKTNGGKYVTDDELGHLLKQFPHKTKVILLIDACHSGTMADLQYRYISGQKYAIENDSLTEAQVLLISGCDDSELANEVWNDEKKQVQGLMSHAFLHALKTHDFDITCWKLIKYMQEYITDKNYHSQVPQLCTSRRLTQTSIFVSPYHSEPFLMTS
jgi:hypothetical protein